MSEKHNQFRHKFYLIIGLLFFVVIVLWLFLGSWQKQFSQIKSEKKVVKTNIFLDMPGLWARSSQQFHQIVPDAKNKKDTKEYVTNLLLDKALERSTQYKGVVLRYPDKWAVLENTPSSTITMIALDGEKFWVDSFDTSTSTDPIGSWHLYRNENILEWSWLKAGDGFVGRKNINNGEKIVGIYQVSSTTILTIQRESIYTEKLKDGLMETIVSGLRK